MATDTLPESQSLRPLPRRQPASRPRRAPRTRWWKRGVLVCGVIAVLVSVSLLFTDVMSSRDSGPRLTHTITRGDLLVTLIEQGTLESSENTEIKCKVRGRNTVIWVVENGTMVQPGDELVRLDTLFMEEQINERTKYAHGSRSAAERSAANVARSELAVAEYEQGRYVSELLKLEKELVVAESTLRSAKDMLQHAQLRKESGYVSELEVEEKEFAVVRAELDVEVKKTELDVHKRFTKSKQLQILKGNVAATKANHEANAERALADASRRDRAVEEFEHCVVRAERAGLVIHPTAAPWERAPEIEEGATVHKDQVLLLMPDLSKMQVKVGVHESVIDRMKPGLSARVILPTKTLCGTVSSVASVTRPAGWRTGNEVRYDTLVRLPPVEGLRPGMSAEVEVMIAKYEDVLTIPVAAVVETNECNFCWVTTPQGPRRRTLVLGDSNDVFTIVEEGLEEGDQVLLNPLALQLDVVQAWRRQTATKAAAIQKAPVAHTESAGSQQPPDTTTSVMPSEPRNSITP